MADEEEASTVLLLLRRCGLDWTGRNWTEFRFPRFRSFRVAAAKIGNDFKVDRASVSDRASSECEPLDQKAITAASSSTTTYLFPKGDHQHQHRQCSSSSSSRG